LIPFRRPVQFENYRFKRRKAGWFCMQVSTSIMSQDGSIPGQMLEDDVPVRLNMWGAVDESSSCEVEAAPESEAGADESDAGLDDAARDEQEYVRQRLREELKREPTEEEMDEWLREHTEGY
jgi:hypothetical protein